MKVAKIIFVLAMTAVISGISLSFVYQATLPRIEQNRTDELKSSIFVVSPLAKSYEKKKVVSGEYYQVYDENKKEAGIAFLAAGSGYAGEIRIIVGLTQDLTTITGIKVMEQVETPGLGANIVAGSFTSQFKNLNVTNMINCVKTTPQQPNEIKAITGATISSVAVTNIINKEIKRFRELLFK